MSRAGRCLVVVALLATLLLPASPANVNANEPTEPTREWVKTSDDSVVSREIADALEEPHAGNRFEPLVSGAGFNGFDLRGFGEYDIRLVTSGSGNIENYRAELQQTANEINAQTNIIMNVLPGTVGPLEPWELFADVGEIWVMIAGESPCGPLDGSALGCGGPDLYGEVDGEYRFLSGVVWLSPVLSSQCQQIVTNHEVGHALGLAHFDGSYLSRTQVMKSSTDCSYSAYREGDVNGLRWLSEPVPYNDSVGAAEEICPLRDTTSSAVTWFASKQSGEPAHAGFGPRRSVWYKYLPQPDQVGELATIRTTHDGYEDFDTVLAVYSGSMFGGAVPVVSNDETLALDGTSEVSFTIAAGATYWIAVDGYEYWRGETDVEFDLPPATLPSSPIGVPVRLMDTRRPFGRTVDCYDAAVGRIAAGSIYELQVAGRGFVPSDAESVVLNVTAHGPSGYGYLTVFPCGGPVPMVSNLNFTAGDVIPNLVIARVGVGGKVCFYSSVETGLIVDVSSHFMADDAFQPLNSPERLLDTRPPDPYTPGTPLAAGVPRELQVAGVKGVPADAAAVVLNVTAVSPWARGFITVYPCGPGDPPLASNLNFAAGEVIPNAVLAKVGVDGKVCFVSSVDVYLIVDVSGYFPTTPSLQFLEAPRRVLDTRAGFKTHDELHQGVGRVLAGATYELPIAGRVNVPADAVTVVLNVTAIRPSASGFITVYPCGTARPTASNLNFAAGDVIPNAVLATIGVDETVCIYSSAQTDLVVDVSGYFV